MYSMCATKCNSNRTIESWYSSAFESFSVRSLLNFRCVAQTFAAKIFRRTKVTRLRRTVAYDDFLQHNTGINHRNFQRVPTGRVDGESCLYFSNAVAHSLLPIRSRIRRECVNDEGRSIVERDSEPKTAAGNVVERGREDCFDIELTTFE